MSDGPGRATSGSRDPECLFCRIEAGAIPSTRVAEDDLVIAFRDINPRAPTHVLVMPREHIRSAAELTDADAPLVGHVLTVAAEIARSEGIADKGYRIVTNVGDWGGQSVDHLHFHVMGGRALGTLGVMGGAARRALAPMALALGLAIAATGCVTTRNTFPPLGSTPGPPGEATTALVARVIGALRDQGLAADVSARPFRPVEGPLLAAAARTVIEVALPDAPSNAWVVVYEVASAAAATAAAQDHAAYVAAGIGGGVLYPPGTQFVLQVVDTDVIFFTWLPAGAADGRTAMIAQALRSIGSPVDVPR